MCDHQWWLTKLSIFISLVFNNVFKRVIEQANGNKIWVPLSAGYDSRTVLAKLLELGYDRIQTFSYGTPGNMESVVAKEISEKAGVPWCFVSSNLSQKSDKQFTTDLIDFFWIQDLVLLHHPWRSSSRLNDFQNVEFLKLETY